MPVITQYVVERDGTEKMTFTSKTEADAYDKLLDTADALYELLDGSDLAGDHAQKEALSMYLAENKDALLNVLGNKKKSPAKPKKSRQKDTDSQLDLSDSTPKKPLEDLVIEPDEDILYSETDSEDSNRASFDEDILDYAESDAA
ncbi:YebG family protein [Marinomonas algarum]|uniref:YebG family protein n=1 Tax=Marinomonas algarum TaxID=2883105 RepID=A0A9X1IM94_9GAMM|nr:YebG family protein [Marinomonas algarum]MCB5161492.1 YebG family protein [Marinomonas algarum]